MKKHIANIISATRIIAAIGLFFFKEIKYPFVFVYIYCGFTDLIDGKIARKLGTTSVLGAYMDTVGDVLTYLALAKILVFVQKIVPFWIILWYIVAMIGNIIAAAIAKKRHGEFYFIHSLFGKLLGVTLFILPLMLRVTESIKSNNILCLSVICTVASISALETIYIQLKSKEAITDISSLKQIINL